ncbi:formate dehydrogenase accessory sulfurtransferase FdhD [Anaeromyxobacter oryzae]|uniref:Sulfur carrier protein FdhD n=1 Tax=Anaeromyxobacter oryzae TaxID=2918170 RepID=A0ABM7WY96_9BACT|nr:formate dehydrogenase accessory sulfurtransferase FdhD [Anaeromyxobacter oryzae]BDG04498.1 sulfurtransferase FdhD [Anaeromyxobacter oryzae]
MDRPAAPAGAVATRPVVRDGAETVDAVAVEEPLEIRVDGDRIATTMRTPGSDHDLALGFLLAEGIIAGAEDVGSMFHCGRPGEEGYGNVLDVTSAGGHRIDPERILDSRRFLPVSSACGVCGREAIDRLLARVPAVASDARADRALVVRAMDALRRSQPVFERTGGLHAAVLVGAGGEVLAAAEDVGRHNAVDKVVGALLRQGVLGARATASGRPVVLAVSGRAGFEIVQKAAVAGVPVVASVSAPSSLAVDLAVRAGVALLGFVRGERMNVYAHAWRVDATASCPR